MKSTEEEIDWKLLDQLHGAVSQISSFCFEVKKFCVTTLFAAITVVLTITARKLDHSVFIVGLLIPLCFWFLDATGYYYQVKLRGMMEAIKVRLAKRSGNQIVSASGLEIISASRTSASAQRRVLDAGFNHSMWVYLLLVVLDLLAWALYSSGHIK
jgi:hypothetical protein